MIIDTLYTFSLIIPCNDTHIMARLGNKPEVDVCFKTKYKGPTRLREKKPFWHAKLLASFAEQNESTQRGNKGFKVILQELYQNCR